MKKKVLYWIAIAVLGGMVLAMILAVAVPPIREAVNRNRLEPVRKTLTGDWRADAFDGKGSKWITFGYDGTCSLYQELIAPDGQSIHQSSSTYGSSTWEVLTPTTVKITVSTMGYSNSEEVVFELTDDHTLVLDGDTYIKQ